MSVFPRLLPLFALLVLLLLPVNRDARAWWVLAPFAIGWVAESILNSLQGIPSGMMEFFGPLISAITFALTALWLLAGGLAWKNRFLAFLGSAAILAAAALGSFLPGAIASLDYTTVPLTVMLLVVALVMSVSLNLGGVLCRGRWGATKIAAWTLVSVALCTGLAFGFSIGISALMDSAPALDEAVTAWVITTAALYAFLLPYLLLSAFNALYRARLQAWLHLHDSNQSGMLSVAPPVIHAESVGRG